MVEVTVSISDSNYIKLQELMQNVRDLQVNQRYNFEREQSEIESILSEMQSILEPIDFNDDDFDDDGEEDYDEDEEDEEDYREPSNSKEDGEAE